MAPPRRPSARLPETPNPLLVAPGRPHANAILGAPPTTFERGVVLEVDARRHSYRVSLNSGRTATMGRIRASPGDTGLLEPGTNVVVSNALGEPYIFGILPLGTAHTDAGPTLSGLDGHGGADPALDRGLTASARDPGAPTDLLPGDAALRGPDGASVAALRGRVAQLQGGPLARVQAFGDGDRVHITAGELRTSTWVGESAYTNEGGHTNYRWRGGTDQTTQTGPDEGRYTVALDVGSEGDVIRLELTNREGQALFRLHVDAQGHVELFAAGGIAQTGGDGPGAVHETAHHGSGAHEITGDRSERVGGLRKDEIGGAWHAAAGSLIEVVSGTDLVLTGVGSASLRSGGETLLTATALAKVAGRGVTIDPRLESFLIDTALPDRIVLGTGASSHGTKYEELVTILSAIISRLNALSASVAGHRHDVVTSPSPMALPDPSLAAYASSFTVRFEPAKALVVKLR